MENELSTPGASTARLVRRLLPAGVVAVTTVADGRYRAATVSACIVTSIEPLQILLSIESESQMCAWLDTSRIFAVSVLTTREQFFADQFAGFTPLASPDFRGIGHFTAETGSPILSGAIAWADCRIVSAFETGDHHCFVGEAVRAGRGEGAEDGVLVYYLNRYRRLDFT